ncbi:MAG TPA: S-layer homology domain-containing protein, partial [Bacillota bacterium]|nr:S-layer homology domain-containing protein [Bacillota bacterium]
PTFTAAGAYFDVAAAPGSTFTAVTIQQCGVASAADEVYWWNGSSWAAASDQSFAGGCITVTVNASTSPSLSDLTGTPFAVGTTPTAPASGSGTASITLAVPTTATVGTDGGTLTTADGAFTMAVAAGVVPAGQVLRATDGPAAPAGAPALPTGTVAAGPFITVAGPAPGTPGPATFQFSAAALGGLASDRLCVYALGPGGWTFLPTAVDPAAGTVSANIAGPATYVVLADTVPLADVPSGFWAAPAIDRALAAGVVVGFPDHSFQPQASVTRAQLAKMLAIALSLPLAGSGATAFSDVTAQAWYAPYVAAAAQAGIVAGIGGGRFDPDAPVTREQVALMLARALHLTGTPAAAFLDQGAIDVWAAPGIQAAVAAGLLRGFPDGTFQPLAVATRAQAATILAAVLVRMAP